MISRLQQKFEKIDMARILVVVLVIYAAILSFATLKEGTYSPGETPTYMITTASLINDQNGIISQQDVQKAIELFPGLAPAFEVYNGSGYTTSQGIVPWYFPTYSAVCVPGVLLMGPLTGDPSLGFCLTNLVLFLLLLLFVVLDKQLKLYQRYLLFFLFALHPVLFYLSGGSAEAFQCIGVAFAALCWATGRKHRAALCIAIVGTTNPCALAMGLAMIAEYLIDLFLQGEKEHRLRSFFSHWKQILLYGCCYLPGLVPFVYNYSICGSINLTASHGSEWVPLNDFTVFRHLWAYLTDWNFGLLPYMPLLLILAVALIIPAVKKRCRRYLWMLAGMLGMLLGCSLMNNINCGMLAISRYGVWVSPVLAVAACTQLDKLLDGIHLKRAAVLLICSALYSGLIFGVYYEHFLGLDDYKHVTPVAEIVIKYAPVLYDPLPSTFVFRANGYEAEKFPYCQDRQSYIHKLYISAENAQTVRNYLDGADEKSLQWLDKRLNSLTEEPEYVNVPAGVKLFLRERREIDFATGWDAALGTLTDGTLLTDGNAGYAMLGPSDTLDAGVFTITLHAECQAMPADAPAQLQVGINGEKGFVLVASTPLSPDGTAQMTFKLKKRTGYLDYRVYQNEGTTLAIRSVTIERVG